MLVLPGWNVSLGVAKIRSSPVGRSFIRRVASSAMPLDEGPTVPSDELPGIEEAARSQRIVMAASGLTCCLAIQ